MIKLYKSISNVYHTKPKIEYDDSAKVHHVVYSETSFSALKKENKELYDSLKKYKKQIDFLANFDYQKEYNIGKVKTFTKTKIDTLYIRDKNGAYDAYTYNPTTYEYKNKDNDSINYELKINSYTEPNWYSLKVNVKDKITLVDKDNKDGTHTLDMSTKNHATISNTTIYKKKKTFWDRFAVGPSVTVGYDTFHKNFGMMVGVGVTFDLTK